MLFRSFTSYFNLIICHNHTVTSDWSSDPDDQWTSRQFRQMLTTTLFGGETETEPNPKHWWWYLTAQDNCVCTATVSVVDQSWTRKSENRRGCLRWTVWVIILRFTFVFSSLAKIGVYLEPLWSSDHLHLIPSYFFFFSMVFELRNWSKGSYTF